MPDLEPEVSVFDNVPNLKGIPARNTITTNGHHLVNGNHSEDNQEVPGENKDKDKVQKISTTGKLHITSNIRQLYSIRRRPKMPPSEIVRATAERTRSRSPSPQQLMKAGPWPHTIITKAVIEPRPHSITNNSHETKATEEKTQSQKHEDAETAAERETKNMNVTHRVDSSSDDQNDERNSSTQTSDGTSNSECDPPKAVHKVCSTRRKRHMDNKLHRSKNTTGLKYKEKSSRNGTNTSSSKDENCVNKCEGYKPHNSEPVDSKYTTGGNVSENLDSDVNRAPIDRNSDKDTKTFKGDAVKENTSESESRIQTDGEKMKMRNKDKSNAESDDNSSGRGSKRVEGDKAKKSEACKAMNNVSVVLKDISKATNNDTTKGDDDKSPPASVAEPSQNIEEQCEGTEDTEDPEVTAAKRVKEMEDILADMLKRHKEEEKAKELDTSKVEEDQAAEVKQQQEVAEENKSKPKPSTQCRTKAMLLQRLRQSTSLENLSDYANKPEPDESGSKTDDNLGVGNQKLANANWRPAVNVRAFTQPIRDHSFRAIKSPAKSSTPVVRPAPVCKPRARKLDTSSRSEPNPVKPPPTKIFKRSEDQPRQCSNIDALKAYRINQARESHAGNGNRVSVTKSKAYQDFVQGLYETKADSRKVTRTLTESLPSRRSAAAAGRYKESESAYSCTTKSSSTDSESGSSRRRRSKRQRTPKYYGPDMFLIDDGMLVNYDKVLKPLIEDNSGLPVRREKVKRGHEFDLEFLQYEGENSADANIKPRKSRNSKHAFTITSARKNTSAYQMKNVEVRLQKMTIDEERVVRKARTQDKNEHNFPVTVFGNVHNVGEYGKRHCDDEDSEGKTSTDLDEFTASEDEDSVVTDTTMSPTKNSDAKDTSSNGVADDVFLTPGSSFKRSHTEPEMSNGSLLLAGVNDYENEKENYSNAAKQLLEEEKHEEKSKETKNGHKTDETWRPCKLDFRSIADDASADLTSEDELPIDDKLNLPLNRKVIVSTTESESELSTASRSETDSSFQHRRKPKHPKKAFLGNPQEQTLSAKYGVIKYGKKLSNKKKEHRMSTDSESVACGAHDSSASTVTFPLDKDDETEKGVHDDDDDDDDDDNTVAAASDCETVVDMKSGSNSAISAWNDSVNQTFDKAIDLCMRSNKDAVAMSTDSDPDQESLNLQLDDLDDTLEDVKSPVSRETKSQSDTNLRQTSEDDGSNFHFFDKGGSVVGRIMKESSQPRRSASSDQLLDKITRSPVSTHYNYYKVIDHSYMINIDVQHKYKNHKNYDKSK